MNKAKEDIASPTTMGNKLFYAKDMTEAEQKSVSSEADVPTNPKQDETECEQRNESKIDHTIDFTVDWTECAPTSTASNRNDSEDVKGGINGVKVTQIHTHARTNAETHYTKLYTSNLVYHALVTLFNI